MASAKGKNGNHDKHCVCNWKVEPTIATISYNK
jgi:hypothetical protein